MDFQNENIWIIGASSGIGEATARLLAPEGATLFLSARSEDKLRKLKNTLRGNHYVHPLDVSSRDDVFKVAKTIKEKHGRIDRIIFLAAIYEPTAIEEIDPAFAEKTFKVNMLGALHLTQALIPILETQKKGQLVFCASVAGYTGLPYGQPYGASKAALINFVESLAAEVEDYIDIKLINPGFVKTALTDKNDFDMPMRIEPKEAAAEIVKGLNQKPFEIHFPKKFTYVMKLVAALPYFLNLAICKTIAKKRKEKA
nr:SDR family NAD(P)-dependent oxidoreductase [Cytophagales bacterium]